MLALASAPDTPRLQPGGADAAPCLDLASLRPIHRGCLLLVWVMDVFLPGQLLPGPGLLSTCSWERILSSSTGEGDFYAPLALDESQSW